MTSQAHPPDPARRPIQLIQLIQPKLGRLTGLVAFGLFALSGCTSLPPDAGFAPLQTLAQQRLGQELQWARTEADQQALAAQVARLLAAPELSVDHAVQIALINNPGLQATYWRLGVAQADLLQAATWPNPSLGFQRSSDGADAVIERSLSFGLVRLLTAPLAQRIEQSRLEQTRLEVADAMLTLAAETRKAHVEAVAAQQTLAYAQQVLQAAQAGAELAQRAAQAGNWSALEQAREQLFWTEAQAALTRAERATQTSRNRLLQLMGVRDTGSNTPLRLPSRLPELPATALNAAVVQQVALRQRLDLQAAQLQLAHTAQSLQLTRRTRWINALELGPVSNSETGKPTSRGYALSLEIPLFDWGTARTERAQALYMAAAARLAEQALAVSNQAQDSYEAYRAALALAQHHRDQVLPLRQRIAQEVLLRYNGMLAGVFELLADAREQARAVSEAIQAQRDFWLAEAQLQAVLGGRLQDASLSTPPTAIPAAPLPPQQGPRP